MNERRTLSDRLAATAPPPPLLPPGVENTIDDLTRILALPRRPIVQTQVDPRTGRLQPATQALVEVVTARYTRGPRLSCACRPRHVQMDATGRLVVFRKAFDNEAPEPPLLMTVAAFIADAAAVDATSEVVQRVRELRPGDGLDLLAADGSTVGYPCIDRLNAPQAWLLQEAPQVGGAVGFLGVGSGKTISNILAPLAFPDCGKAVLLIEPKQRHHYRSHYLRLREHFRVPSVVFDDAPGCTVPGTVPLHIISYSVLSQPKNTDLLFQRNPGLVIFDEAHRVCGDSAIRRRMKLFFVEKIKAREAALRRGEPVRRRAVYLLSGSGTLEVKSVEDTQPLCAFALGTGSPLPIDDNEATAWSNVIDPVRQPDRKSQTAKALQRAFGGRVYEPDSIAELMLGGPEEEIRKGFQRRRVETLGVITSSAANINAAIYLSEFAVPAMPEVVRSALLDVRAQWLRPDGDEIAERVEQVAIARQVACGFYSYWAFLKHPCTCPVPVVEQDRCSECKLIADWYAKRKAFNKELRTQLQKGETHLDSRKNCEDAAERFWRDPPYQGELPKWSSASWPAWRDIENRVEHEERVRWLGWNLPEAANPATHPGYYLARHIAAWAQENQAVIWFQSVALGRKIAELGKLPYFNGGPGGEERLRAEKGDRSIVVSISAHGAGTDGLQHEFSNQLIVECPASNATQRGLEQILGRLHRQGQRADVVNTLICQHATEFKDAYRSAVIQARFNSSMQGLPQKLLMADSDIDD
jgi:hypothetical protein